MRSQVVQELGESSTEIRFARDQELARGGTMSEQAGGDDALKRSYVRWGHNSCLKSYSLTSLVQSKRCLVKSKTNQVQSKRRLAVSQSKSWIDGEIQCKGKRNSTTTYSHLPPPWEHIQISIQYYCCCRFFAHPNKSMVCGN